MSTSTRDSRSSLKAGDYLPLQGPSVYQGLTPSNDPPTPDSPAIPPLRPAHQALLAKDGPALSSTGWVIQLKEEIGEYKGIGRFQTWIAEVKRSKDSKEGYQVLFKINRPELYVKAHVGRGAEAFTTIIQWVENTAAHFRCYARLQGREVQRCYGLYTFDRPGEGRCFGFVIEDVTSDFISVARWSKAVQSTYSEELVMAIQHRGETTPLSANSFETFIRSGLQAQSRFSECAPEIVTPLEDLLVLKSSTPWHIHFITTGWLVPEPLALLTERFEGHLIEYEEREGVSLREQTGSSKSRILKHMQYIWQCQDPTPTNNLCYRAEQYLLWELERTSDEMET